jgi:hypothetical protein
MTTGHRHRLSRMCLAIFALLSVPSIGPFAAAPAPAKPASAPVMGQLKIEGNAVERLILWKLNATAAANPGKLWNSFTDAIDQASSRVLKRPGPSVMIPVGTYILASADLSGGYTSFPPLEQFDPQSRKTRVTAERLNIIPDKPCVLRIGLPLKAALRTYRRGRTILIAYELLDSEGHRYASTKRGSPPRFTVSSNGREVASGSFEYG